MLFSSGKSKLCDNKERNSNAAAEQFIIVEIIFSLFLVEMNSSGRH